MANSRIMLVCRHCGGSMVLGKGYFGDYFTVNQNKADELNDFFDKHKAGRCAGDINCSDNARVHFTILEEGETLEDLTDIALKREAVREVIEIIDERHSALEKETEGRTIAWHKASELEGLKVLLKKRYVEDEE